MDIYPFYRNYFSEEKIIKDFNKLKKYEPSVIENITPSALLSFEINYSSELELIKITDWFSEEARIKCRFSSFCSPLEYYTKNKKKYESHLGNYFTIDNELSKIRSCNNFPTTIVITVLKFFKPKNMLDFSSGWGDRLIGAMAYGCEYTGVDPSSEMKSHYTEMISFFDGKAKVFQKGFEDFKVKKDHYDLVFTSPPFFDLEKYEDSPTQSINKYKTIESWKKNFLFPSLKKSLIALKKEKYLAIYVSDYKNIKYTQAMKDYIKSLDNNKFMGTINWKNIDGSNKIRNIYVWKKY